MPSTDRRADRLGRSGRGGTRRARGARFAGLIAAALILVAHTAADPITGADLLRQRREELRALKAEIAATRRETERLRRESADGEQILGELERQRSLTERYLRRLATQAEEVAGELERLHEQLRLLEARRDSARADLGRSLRYYHKHQRVTAAELLVSSETFSELFARGHYWVRAIHGLRADLDHVLADEQAVELQLAEIATRRSELTTLRAEREAQLARLAEQERVRREHQAQLEQRIARFESQARKLEASQTEIEKLIEQAQRATGSAGVGLAHLAGRLPWPVEGPILTPFGTQVHPRYGTRVEQKGIEIGAAEGTPIRAVAAGRVAYRGWLAGYGHTVILDHGEGFFTLYAHAAEILAGAGASVAGGEPIARVGSTDSIRGSCLHFEVRRGSRALDPSAWLAAR